MNKLLIFFVIVVFSYQSIFAQNDTYRFMQKGLSLIHISPEKTKEIFKSERENIGICPKCNNKVAIYPKSYSCENWKKGCDFRIWNKIAGKAITKAQAIKLLNKGKTDLIKGFKSKTGNSFEAYLILKENNEVGFYFPPRKEQKNE